MPGPPEPPDRDEIVARLRTLSYRPADHSPEEIRAIVGPAIEELEASPKRRKKRPKPTACDGQLTVYDVLASIAEEDAR